MLPVMAKKKPRAADTPPPSATMIRPDDPRIFTAIDAYARTLKQSRNMAMVILLEDALRRVGFWPPPADPE